MKVLSFFAAVGAGSTTLCISYLSEYPDQFYNVSIHPVSPPLLMSTFFGAVNEVDSHNMFRQSDIAMDKVLVTKCGWLRFCTTVSMGTTITNCWKMFCYGVKRNHFNKSIRIREFSEKLLLIASIILSQQTQARRQRTYLPLMKLTSKALFLPFGASNIPVLILTIQRSA